MRSAQGILHWHPVVRIHSGNLGLGLSSATKNRPGATSPRGGFCETCGLWGCELTIKCCAKTICFVKPGFSVVCEEKTATCTGRCCCKLTTNTIAFTNDRGKPVCYLLSFFSFFSGHARPGPPSRSGQLLQGFLPTQPLAPVSPDGENSRVTKHDRILMRFVAF